MVHKYQVQYYELTGGLGSTRRQFEMTSNFDIDNGDYEIERVSEKAHAEIQRKGNPRGYYTGVNIQKD